MYRRRSSPEELSHPSFSKASPKLYPQTSSKEVGGRSQIQACDTWMQLRIERGMNLGRTSHRTHKQTGFTPAGDSKFSNVNDRVIVYDPSFTVQSVKHQRVYLQALPDILYVGNGSCDHPFIYQVKDVCLICFFKDGFQNEIPGQIHFAKSLADNGNPQQTGRMMAHVSLVAGFRPPNPNQNMRDYRRSREQYTKVAHGLFPFTSALWELMSFQPPLATPTILLISGLKAPKIAEKLDISIYNVQERVQKGINLAVGFLRA